MRACPYCAEQIQDAATLCRFCRSAVEPVGGGISTPPPPLPPTQPVPPPLFAPVPIAPNSYAADVVQNARGAFGAAATPYRRASFGARAVAKFIDYVVGWGPAVLAWALFELVIIHVLKVAANGESGALLIPLALLVVAGWGTWYTFTKDGNTRGAGVGKRVMGLMVVQVETGEPCTKGQCAIRQVVLHLAGIIPVLGWLAEPLTAILTSGGRRLGDFAAGTQVVSASEWKETRERPMRSSLAAQARSGRAHAE